MNETNGHIQYESSEVRDIGFKDSMLVKDISLGNPEAFEILMGRYLPMVSRVSYRILCDITESEKVTREVFVRLWREAGDYDFRHSVSIWMYRMICDLCMSRVRRLRLMDLIISDSSVYEMSEPTPVAPEDDYITKETWGIYCRAARSLTARQRMVFVLRELEELSTGEVASIMHMNSGCIRDNLLIARDRIKYELAKYGKVI